MQYRKKEKEQVKFVSLFLRHSLGEAGSGIGLNLVQELVTLSKGTIRAESKIVEGTSFHLVFTDAVV